MLIAAHHQKLLVPEAHLEFKARILGCHASKESVASLNESTTLRNPIYPIDPKESNLLQSTEGMIGGVDVTRFRAASQHAQPGKFPDDRIIDHKLAENPYQSLYGENWKGVIA